MVIVYPKRPMERETPEKERQKKALTDWISEGMKETDWSWFLSDPLYVYSVTPEETSLSPEHVQYDTHKPFT